MIRVDESCVVDAPVEEVWALLRDFNGHEDWHPAIAESVIEDGRAAGEVGCVRAFTLTTGEALREELTALSDAERGYAYRILSSDIPLLDYHARLDLRPVTASARTFWRWRSRFRAPPGQARELTAAVRDGVYRAGFAAVQARLG